MMEDSSRSLLDLLNPARKPRDNRGDLLALFTTQGDGTGVAKTSTTQADPITPGTTSRKGNASDLLAALMGTTSPQPTTTRAEDSANLLSSLLDSSRSSETKAVESPIGSHTSYLNPRHEYLRSADTTQKQSSISSESNNNKPCFNNSNPFDELEQVVKPSGQSSPPNLAHTDIQSRHSLTPRLDGDLSNPTTLQHRHASTPNMGSSEEAYRGTPEPTSGGTMPGKETPMRLHIDQEIEPQAAQRQEQQQDRQQQEREQQDQQRQRQDQQQQEQEHGNLHIQSGAYSLVGDISTLCTIPTDMAHGATLRDPIPITKMGLKYDPAVRNIITASRKYFAYPVNKEGVHGRIRVVDQITGATILLEHHTSKVVDLSFAKIVDSDGSNALISTDSESNVVLWTISEGLRVERQLEVSGPSDASHKSRAKWNQDGTYFAISLTSRIYVFDYRAIALTAKPLKIRLHPEGKHYLCICKAEKAIKDFSFSLDNTSIAAVDKAANIRLWNLESNNKSLSLMATIATGDRPLLSVQFLDQRHLIVGTASKGSLLLVDLESAKTSQELKFPPCAPNEQCTVNPAMYYLAESQALLLQNQQKQSIYYVVLNLPKPSGQATSAVIAKLSPKSSHSEATGQFRSLLELGPLGVRDQRFLNFACSYDKDSLDLFVAHEKGFELFTIPVKALNQCIKDSKVSEKFSVTKLEFIGSLVDGNENKEASRTETKERSRPISPEVQVPNTRSHKKSSRIAEPHANGLSSTEPRTAEFAARIEASLRASIIGELQKNNAVLKKDIGALQSSSDSRHETILRLVSETLSKNTTKVLKTVICEAVDQTILPLLRNEVEDSIAKQMRTTLTTSLETFLSKEVTRVTKEAIDGAFQNIGLLKEIQDVTKCMKEDLDIRHKQMEQNLAGALVRLDSQMQARQKEDSEKINRLLAVVESLQVRLSSMPMPPSASPITDAPHDRRAVLPHIPALSHPNNNAINPSGHIQGQPVPPQVQLPPPPPAQDFSKFHDLIMDFVGKSQKIAAGDFDGVPFVRQFLSWQPDAAVKDGICLSLGNDQLQLLAFVHALASELSEDDAFNRAHWIASAVKFLAIHKDARLETLGPRLLGIVRENLVKVLERATTGSQFRQLVILILGHLKP